MPNAVTYEIVFSSPTKWRKMQKVTRTRQHSQECIDPCRQCFWDSWPWRFYPKLNGFPGLTVEHFYFRFGDPRCVGIWAIMWYNRQKHGKNVGKNPTTTTAVSMGKYKCMCTWFLTITTEIITGPPTHSVGGRTSSARLRRLSASVTPPADWPTVSVVGRPTLRLQASRVTSR